MRFLNTSLARNNPTIVSLAILFLATVVWAVFPKVYTFSDPIYYLQLAHELGSIDTWEMDHPFKHRLILLLLHWMSFEAFGVNTFSAVLPQLVIFIALMILAARQCSTFIGKLYAVSVLLLLFPQSLDVFPDLGAAAFMFFAVLALRDRDKPKNGVIFVACAMSAFLFKLTAVFLALPYLIALARDYLTPRLDRKSVTAFHITLIVSALIVTATYLSFIYMLTGDPFARLNAVNSYGELHLWKFDGVRDIFERLFVDPPSFFGTFLGFSFFLAIIGSVLSIRENKPDRDLSEYLLITVVLFVFFSTSLSTYNPLPLLDRMAMFIVPPMAIVGGNFIPVLMQRISTHPASRFVIYGFILSMSLHWSLLAISRTFLSNVDHIHHVRAYAASLMSADESTVLIVAESRTQSAFNIYFDFQNDTQDRIFVCPAEVSLQGAEKALVLIDFTRSRFLREAYDETTCELELKKWSVENDFQILRESDKYFLAMQKTT